MGQVSFGNVGNAAVFALPIPFKWGFEFNARSSSACA
jgi:xanthine/uracil permease